MAGSSPLLHVQDLTLGFALRGDVRRAGLAVDGASFTLRRGKVLCLVGESGCGKSVTALSIPRLLPSPPALLLGGSVMFDGLELSSMSESELRHIRGNRIGMVFQDPMTSLNPVIRVGDQMVEGLKLHRKLSPKAAHDTAVSMLAKVQLADPEARMRDFPHEMSGGMRQRVMIAMALSCEPELLIADEPTTALDVTVQKQILALLRQLIDDTGSALLLITHDFGVVAQVADEVAVMYAGRIVEQGPAREVLRAPAHPYTRGLLGSRPGVHVRRARLEAIPGTVPGLWARPPGCSFHPRCSQAFAPCAQEVPPLFPVGMESGTGEARQSRCWLCRERDVACVSSSSMD